MFLYDTLTKSKRKFIPLKGNEVKIYTCGPSVYNYSHIGNFRTYLFEDILVRYLKYKRYKVNRVMNITDVEDKAIDESNLLNIPLNKLVKDKIDAFLCDFEKLRILKPNNVVKASSIISQIIQFISILDKKGYVLHEKDGLYFNVKKFKTYGKLVHLKSTKYLGTMKKDDYSKEGKWDFRLWKFWTKKDGNIFWNSPYGKGRPGWHIECSAIALTYLGEQIDIHCGGVDNIFPHHENEIAQSEAATGKKFVNFWLHSKHLTIGKKKMSKRTGNVMYVSELEKIGVPPKCLRFYLISEKYNHKLDFTFEQFNYNICKCEIIRDFIESLKQITLSKKSNFGKNIAIKLIEAFELSMDNDLNTKEAFTRIIKICQETQMQISKKQITKSDAKQILAALKKIDSVFMIF